MLMWAELRDRFKAERKRSGLRQEDVAKRGGVDQSAISKIESDPSYTPLVDTFVNAVHGLGLSATEFFSWFEGLKVTPGSGTSPAGASHAESDHIRPPEATAADLQAFVLDLIDALGDVVATHDARRQTRQTLRQTPKTRRHQAKNDSGT